MIFKFNQWLQNFFRCQWFLLRPEISGSFLSISFCSIHAFQYKLSEMPPPFQVIYYALLESLQKHFYPLKQMQSQKPTEHRRVSRNEVIWSFVRVSNYNQRITLMENVECKTSLCGEKKRILVVLYIFNIS